MEQTFIGDICQKIADYEVKISNAVKIIDGFNQGSICEHCWYAKLEYGATENIRDEIRFTKESFIYFLNTYLVLWEEDIGKLKNELLEVLQKRNMASQTAIAK